MAAKNTKPALMIECWLKAIASEGSTGVMVSPATSQCVM